MAQNLLSQLGMGEAKQGSAESLTPLEDAYASSLTQVREANKSLQPTAFSNLSPPTSPDSTEDALRAVPIDAYLPSLTTVSPSDPPTVLRTRIVRKWSGVVEEIVDDFFTGRLTSFDPETEELLAEFAVDEVSEDDRALLKPGGWFYLNVSKESFDDGRQSTISSLRFRRLKRWTEEEFALAEERAGKMAELLSDGD